MSSEREMRPGTALIACGAGVIGLSLGRCVAGGVAGPSRVVFELTNLAIGLACASAGWWRLSRAKAGRPDLSWRKFIGTDLLALGVVATYLLAVSRMSSEQRESVMQSLREFLDLVHLARGGP